LGFTEKLFADCHYWTEGVLKNWRCLP